MKNKSLLGIKRGSAKLPLNIAIGPNLISGHSCPFAHECKTKVIQRKVGDNYKLLKAQSFFVIVPYLNCSIEILLMQGGIIIG